MRGERGEETRDKGRERGEKEGIDEMRRVRDRVRE
jgi:hypothetical protein